jgi:hypothetical protein
MRTLADLGVAPPPGIRPTEATIGSIWLGEAGRPTADDLLEWPADMFAFTDLVLERTEAYRFVVSPPGGRSWPPATDAPWPDRVSTAARRWAERAGAERGEPSDLVATEWRVLRTALDTRLDEIGSGRAWRTCEALLTLHAVSDEACAGVAAGTSSPDDEGIVLRARMRELLARTGSIARIDPTRLRVLPKYRTPSGGITARSISRYATRATSAVSYSVQTIRTPSRDSARGEMNVLLLPWPLQVSPKDFQALPQSIHERNIEPFGLFRYQPSEPFDVSHVDRLLSSAAAHVDRVDAVVAPESSVPHEALAELEATLSRHDVTMLVAGLRNGPRHANGLTSNWVHFGASVDGHWRHYRQDKHHRWSLDRSQIEQYHLASVLDPRVRWWEAIEIKRRSLQVLEREDGHTIASLVCEDLAQIDEVVELLRAVGPTLVVALLLDGPQLASRWTARYASVLADDPGSAVLTLTSYGMAASAGRKGREPSAAVALWKDSARGGLQEISLAPHAEAILLQLQSERVIRRTADGRPPEYNATDLRLGHIVQLDTAPAPPPRPDQHAIGKTRPE